MFFLYILYIQNEYYTYTVFDQNWNKIWVVIVFLLPLYNFEKHFDHFMFYFSLVMTWEEKCGVAHFSSNYNYEYAFLKQIKSFLHRLFFKFIPEGMLCSHGKQDCILLDIFFLKDKFSWRHSCFSYSVFSSSCIDFRKRKMCVPMYKYSFGICFRSGWQDV